MKGVLASFVIEIYVFSFNLSRDKMDKYIILLLCYIEICYYFGHFYCRVKVYFAIFLDLFISMAISLASNNNMKLLF